MNLKDPDFTRLSPTQLAGVRVGGDAELDDEVAALQLVQRRQIFGSVLLGDQVPPGTPQPELHVAADGDAVAPADPSYVEQAVRPRARTGGEGIRVVRRGGVEKLLLNDEAPAAYVEIGGALAPATVDRVGRRGCIGSIGQERPEGEGRESEETAESARHAVEVSAGDRVIPKNFHGVSLGMARCGVWAAGVLVAAVGCGGDDAPSDGSGTSGGLMPVSSSGATTPGSASSGGDSSSSGAIDPSTTSMSPGDSSSGDGSSSGAGSSSSDATGEPSRCPATSECFFIDGEFHTATEEAPTFEMDLAFEGDEFSMMEVELDVTMGLAQPTDRAAQTLLAGPGDDGVALRSTGV